MPWCGFWGAGYWWILPLIGLVFMGIMFFACARGFGCMGMRRRASARSDEGAATTDDEAQGGCCGPQARGEPKRT